MTSARVLIIGGGLAGLSAARHLGGEAVVLEAAGEVGGLCRSYRRDGYLFDISGHLLHFRRPSIRRLVGTLLPRGLVRHRRRAFVHFRGRRVDFPFQAHLSQLPEKVRDECLRDFLEAADRRSWSGGIGAKDFRGWVRERFGPGITRHFLEPYNRKLWQVPLEELTVEWAEWSVPLPTPEQVKAAAEGRGREAFGYNAVFYYPKRGGIGSLARSLAGGVPNLRLGDRVVEVDLLKRSVTTARGRRHHFEHLLSTAPLPELLRMCKGLPHSVVEAGERLRCVPVCVFNVGLDRPGSKGMHWMYFPEKVFPFYRVGFAHGFSPSSAPPGCQSLYVEVARPPGSPGGCRRLWGEVREGLVRAGLMERGEEPAVLDVLHVPYAYVLYDRHRAEVLPAIHHELRRRGVLSFGRYGSWEYSSMEEALGQGREAARWLKRLRG